MVKRIMNKFSGSKSIANTLAFILFLNILVVFGILGTFMYANTRAMLVQQQEAMLQTRTQSVIAQFDALFKEKGALVKQMSTNEIFRQYIETTSSSEDVLTSTHAAQTQSTLAAIVKEEPSFADAWVLGIHGKGFWLQNDGVA